ncbi:MAG: tripartite tricarboxylate transporter substrate binding protein [bacterium]|jgi:tripartite-type tricarboxylate transporter receptor subunit TctC|nr:tripartite tricarboxylate transporter substrate binding protein [Betaproteobacteria bacterium]
MHRATAVSAAALTAAFALLSAAAAAQPAYPSKPLRMIVPFTPGGFTDLMARTVGEQLARSLGQPVLIDNRPGANGIIGAEALSKATPDGYTTGMVIAGHSASQSLYAKLPYHAVKSFEPVSLVGVAPLVLVASNSLPAKDLKELLAVARAKPGTISFGSSGIGAAAHLTMELLAQQQGVKMTHVPYKGTTPALADLMGGHIQVMFDTMSAMLPQVRSGKIRALGLSSDTRWPTAPEIPTIAEAGVPGFVSGSWAGVLAPGGTPKPIVDRLSSEIAKIVRLPDVRTRLAELGVEPSGNTPAEFRAFMEAEVARWAKVIDAAKIRLD